MQKLRRLYTKALKKLTSSINPNQEKKYIDISDEYVNWLCMANSSPGFCRGNLYSFDYAIRNLPSKAPIVEIGSFCGLSTNLLTYYKKRHGVQNSLITCDNWEFEGAGDDKEVWDSQISHVDYRAFVKETYVRNIHMFSRYALPYTVETSSEGFFSAWRQSKDVVDVLGRPIRLGGPISFCYIDGNHSYECVKRDFENCDEFLEVGGFCLLDDSEDNVGYPGINQIIAEIKASGKYTVAVKNPNYLFKKKPSSS